MTTRECEVALREAEWEVVLARPNLGTSGPTPPSLVAEGGPVRLGRDRATGRDNPSLFPTEVNGPLAQKQGSEARSRWYFGDNLAGVPWMGNDDGVNCFTPGALAQKVREILDSA